MKIKVKSYRANAKTFEIESSIDDVHLEYDMSEVDYITSDGFAAIIKLKQQGKEVRLVNVNDHIKDTIELIKLEDII